MSHPKTFILVLNLFIALTFSAAAETEINLSGQVRARLEVSDRTFNPDRSVGSVLNLRTRANIEAIRDSNAHAFIQFQDSRWLGDQNQFGEWQSGTLNDGKNVDVHQAYVQIDRLWTDGFGMKAGRFEFVMGNQRVFGSVGWDIVGRSWEGARFWYRPQTLKLSGFYFRVREVEAQNDLNYDLWGLHIGLLENQLELFGVYELDKDTSDVLDPDDNDLDRFTFGLYYAREFGPFDFTMNGAYQTGRMADRFDISAFMVTGEVGYRFEGRGNGRLAAGVDFASGDDDITDGEWNAYNNLYYTGHKFRGYMDYFVGSNRAGLLDLMLRGRIDPFEQWTLKGDLHYFRTAVDYLDPVAWAETSDIGMEFDLTLSTVSLPGATVVGGASIFLPELSFARDRTTPSVVASDDPTFWGYTQVIVDF